MCCCAWDWVELLNSTSITKARDVKHTVRGPKVSLTTVRLYRNYNLNRSWLNNAGQHEVFSTITMFTKAEVVAGRPRPCGKTEFTCSNRRCVPLEQQCDLFNDCRDGGSDEQDCKACKYSTIDTTSLLYDAVWRDETGNHPRDRIRKLHLWCFVIYGNICLAVWDVWCATEQTMSSFWLLHIKRQTQQVFRFSGLMCYQSPVVISSFRRRCMWKESKSMWWGCDLQPDKCQRSVPV